VIIHLFSIGDFVCFVSFIAILITKVFDYTKTSLGTNITLFKENNLKIIEETKQKLRIL